MNRFKIQFIHSKGFEGVLCIAFLFGVGLLRVSDLMREVQCVIAL